MTIELSKNVIDAIADAVVVKMKEPKTGRWIPVTEKLPEKHGQYLVTVKNGYMLLGLWCGIKEDWRNVTAWMPLPEPYKAESERREKDKIDNLY